MRPRYVVEIYYYESDYFDWGRGYLELKPHEFINVFIDESHLILGSDEDHAICIL